MKTTTLLLKMATVAALSVSGMAQASHIDVAGLIHLWSGNGNTLDSVGTANGTLGTTTTYGTGINGQAFNFDGTNNSDLTIPVNISPSAYPQMTMGMFINVESIANNRGWVMGNDDGGYDRALMISDDRFGSGLSAGVGHTYASSLTNLGDTLGLWYGIAVSYDQDAATATVYINDLAGNSTTQTVTTALGNGKNFASLGGLFQWGRHGVDALVDDVFIYDRALNKSELDVVFSEVPEPSTLLIFSSALAGLVVLRRKKQSV
jgi:hypothetical protein